MKQRIIYILLFILILAVSYERGIFNENSGTPDSSPRGGRSEKLAYAYDHQLSDIQVQGEGIVEKVLRDDTKGLAHQRIIVRIGPGHTVLIAHNIDLAPRVENVKKGDRLKFYGEYEWNNKGGVVHWTHHDPKKKHTDGWIMLDGKRYE